MMLPKPNSCVGCSLYTPPYGKPTGFSTVDGSGSSGVAIVGEALGEQEESSGKPFVGKSGYQLFEQLKRVGLERDIFTIANAVFCRPPQNVLVKTPYEKAAISHCAPNLDKALADARAVAVAAGKHFTIVTLGVTAFKRVLRIPDDSPILRQKYIAYPFYSTEYQAWVYPCYHPAYLLRGYSNLWPVVQYVFQQAVEVAEHGLQRDTLDYLLDPCPSTFEQWIQQYKQEHALHPESTYLSFDIETPMKQGMDEEELSREMDDDYTILRCSFAYKPGNAVSVPWRAEYRSGLEELFSLPFTKIGWNCENFDLPRVRTHMPVNGMVHDGMLCFHILNSHLPKGLGFVTPFYWKNVELWKHLSDSKPAYYNAVDSDAALRNFIGIQQNLHENQLWDVYDKHVVQLNPVLSYMSGQGVVLDTEMRKDAEAQLHEKLDALETKMELTVPVEVKGVSPKNGYTKTPRSTAGLVEREFQISVLGCSRCGELFINSTHTKTKKTGNLCESAETFTETQTVTRWCKQLPFKISKKSLLGYQHALRHQAMQSRREKKVTFDETAIKKLIKKYPHDQLYPLILLHRGAQKLATTYIGVTQPDGIIRGGMPTGKDGRVHCTYGHNPSTLRLSCSSPNLQTLPRSGDNPMSDIVRNLVVAAPGHALVELDYSAIEAVLTGYFCSSADYMRLAKLGVHAYLTSHVIGKPADLSWSNADLDTYFKQIKKQHNREYNASKRTIHGCVTGEHEVLTPNGWKRIDEVTSIDRIAQWSANEVTFVQPTVMTTKEWSGTLHSWESRSLSARMTPEHRIPIRNSFEKLQEFTVGNIPDAVWRWGRIPVCGMRQAGTAAPQDAWLQLLVAIQADSSVYGSHAIFHLVKPRKQRRLLSILNQLNIQHTVTPCKCHAEKSGLRIGVRLADSPIWDFLEKGKAKNFNEAALLNLSPWGRSVFLEELPHWDGNRSHGKSGRQTTYISTNERNIDTVQAVAHISGRQAIKTVKGPGAYGVKPVFTLSFNHRTQARLGGKTFSRTAEEYHGLVYCPTVPSGWFMIRHKGKVSITGNSNYGMTPGKMLEVEPELFGTYTYAKRIQDIYLDIFPALAQWQKDIQLQADKDGFLRNPYQYVHRFSKVFNYTKECGVWVRKQGEDSNKVLAFLPQSTAAAILKDAMLRLFARFNEAGQFLRLQIHDSLLAEIPTDQVESVMAVMKEEMERPIPELRLPKSFNLGDFLVIGTDAKVGQRWGSLT